MATTGLNIISTVSCKEVAERRAARETEIKRLGARIARATGESKNRLVSELLAFLGVIHNTPAARSEWENQ